MRQKRWLLVLIVVATFVCTTAFVGVPVLRQWLAERRCGQRHVLPTTNEFSFLPDDFAVRMAAAALHRQGFDTNDWKATFYSQTRAPDGTNDRFLCRNGVNEKQGVLGFTNRQGKFRHVQVALQSNGVECVVRAAQVLSSPR